MLVQCGFEGCDWEAHGDDVAFNASHKLMTKLLAHLVTDHNIPTPRWDE